VHGDRDLAGQTVVDPGAEDFNNLGWRARSAWLAAQPLQPALSETPVRQ